MAKINKCIALLAEGQPIYATHPSSLTYEAGLKDAKTWADMLLLDFEHHPFDTVGLTNYMRGLKGGGSTASGHPTPTVVCTARNKIKAPLDKRGIAFCSSWAEPSMTMAQRADYSIDVLGVRMMAAPNKARADYGRWKTGCTMPV